MAAREEVQTLQADVAQGKEELNRLKQRFGGDSSSKAGAGTRAGTTRASGCCGCQGRPGSQDYCGGPEASVGAQGLHSGPYLAAHHAPPQGWAGLPTGTGPETSGEGHLAWLTTT